MSLSKTAVWRIDGQFGTQTFEPPIRCIWKRGIRVKAADTGEFAGSGGISYGASDELSVGVHFRLEDCYGGHGTERYIAHHWDGTSGWIISYVVATGKIKVYVDDGAGNTATVDADITDEDLQWWAFSFLPGGTLQLFYNGEVVDTDDASSTGNIFPAATTVKLGDATNTIAMMFGGFWLMDSEIGEADLTEMKTKTDDEWSLVGTLVIHTPGCSHDWGGAIGVDIDESSSQWKDVTGNTYHLNMTLNDSSNSMAREIARKTNTLQGRLISLSKTRNGSRCSIYVSENDTVGVGDYIIFKSEHNSFSGIVEQVQKDQGGKQIRCIGSDEEKVEEFSNEVFASRATLQSNKLEDSTNQIVEGTTGSGVAGSVFIKGNTKLALAQDAVSEGHGFADGVMSLLFDDNTPIELNHGDFSLLNRTQSIRHSASDVTVHGYSDADIPYEQTGMASGATTYNLDFQPISVIYVKVGGSEVFTGFRVDSDNQELIFSGATAGNVDIKYTVRDINTATSSDSDVEEEIGKKQRVEVFVGYVGDTPLQAIADALIRGPYWINTIQPRYSKFYATRWYIGQKIRINQSTDVFGINGYYFITKLDWTDNLESAPIMEIEEYPSSGSPPAKNAITDMVDVIDEVLSDMLHSKRGLW